MSVIKNIIAENKSVHSYMPPVLGYIGYIRKDVDGPDWSSLVHKHDYTEAMLCAKGEGIVVIERTEYFVKPGDIIIYPKYCIHRELSNSGKSMEFFFMGVDSFVYPPLPPNELLKNNATNIFPAGPYLPQLQFYMSELLRESSDCESIRQPVLSALSSLVITTILRAAHYFETEGGYNASYGYKVKMYIDANYKQDINLSTLAETVYVSRHYISHIFKDNYGTSPIEYLINKRLSVAKQLLIRTSMPIAEVAQEVGYKDPLYFSQIFKQRMGVSPSAFRNNHAAE